MPKENTDRRLTKSTDKSSIVRMNVVEDIRKTVRRAHKYLPSCLLRSRMFGDVEMIININTTRTPLRALHTYIRMQSDGKSCDAPKLNQLIVRVGVGVWVCVSVGWLAGWSSRRASMLFTGSSTVARCAPFLLTLQYHTTNKNVYTNNFSDHNIYFGIVFQSLHLYVCILFVVLYIAIIIIIINNSLYSNLQRLTASLCKLTQLQF